MTKVTKLVSKEKRSYLIKVETAKKDFIIPVIDVRDGEKEREQTQSILNASNRHKGSRFMRPSYSAGGNSYQNSHKK